MILWLVSIAGAVLFAWPLFGLALPPDLPVMAALIAALLALSAIEFQSRRLDSRKLALLAVIVGVDSALRLMLVMGIAGFSPVFFLVLCAGYIFGSAYGFLCGATVLLGSALVTGGIGPWLPYEMLAAAWCGAIAGLAGKMFRIHKTDRVAIAVLAAVAIVTGFLYGAVMDLWDWTILRSGPGLGPAPGEPVSTQLSHFWHFYLSTSILWDSFRAFGTAFMIIVIGRAVLAGLQRSNRRFSLIIEPPVQELADH